jgi:hypothetical protein
LRTRLQTGCVITMDPLRPDTRYRPSASEPSTSTNRPMHPSTGSDHSSRSPETKLFHVELPDLHVSKEDSVKSWCYQPECQLFEAEHLANANSCLMPTDVSAIVHPSQEKTFRVIEDRQLAWQSDGAWVVETCWHLIVQALMGTLIVEHVTKTIEAALQCTKRDAAGGFVVSSFSVRCIRS